MFLFVCKSIATQFSTKTPIVAVLRKHFLLEIYYHLLHTYSFYFIELCFCTWGNWARITLPFYWENSKDGCVFVLFISSTKSHPYSRWIVLSVDLISLFFIIFFLCYSALQRRQQKIQEEKWQDALDSLSDQQTNNISTRKQINQVQNYQKNTSFFFGGFSLIPAIERYYKTTSTSIKEKVLPLLLYYKPLLLCFFLDFWNKCSVFGILILMINVDDDLLKVLWLLSYM